MVWAVFAGPIGVRCDEVRCEWTYRDVRRIITGWLGRLFDSVQSIFPAQPAQAA